MKHPYTLVVILALGFFYSNAQITLDSTNMPYVGWTETFAKDTPLTSVNYGSAGANQVYNFSSLQNTKSNTATYSAPTGTQHSYFPNADLMVTVDNVNYFAAQKTAAKYIAEGEQTKLTTGKIAYSPFNPVDDLLHFTSPYLSNFTGSWGFYQAVSAADAGQSNPLVDSVYVTYTDTYYDTIDGWGTVKTPVGTYNCLREARRDVTHTNISISVFGSISSYSDSYSDAVTYQYLAKETKGAVVKFDYDTGVNAANVLDAQYSLIPPSPVAYFKFTIGSNGLITFTDSSSNSPASYSWTFGDGGISASASPSHTYAANGAYYVCETVTNASGSNTYCDSVHVTNIIAAPVAHFTFVTGASGLVTFTDGSSGSPTTYSWTFGDGNTSNLKSPTHTYSNDGAYYVCETVTNGGGSNTYCDSVHISNVPAPVAHFTFASGGGGVINFTDVSTGGPTTYSWTFGSSGTSNLKNPSHTYTANGAYYVCETVSNVNGSNTYCDTVHVTGISGTHQAPVANNDSASVNKPNSVTVNVTANDYSPSADSFCVKSVSNTTYFSVQGCGDIVFNSTNAVAPGLDSAWYVVCNVVQTTLCDSALIIVKVQRAHVAPVAVNDTATDTKGDTIAVNVTANDSSPSGDTFCITQVYGSSFFTKANCNDLTFAPDTGFVGKDTAWYVICNNNEPTLCDTAQVVVTVTGQVPCNLTGNIILGGDWADSISPHNYLMGVFAILSDSFSSPVDSFYWEFRGVSYPSGFVDTIFYNLDSLTLSTDFSQNVILDVEGYSPAQVCLVGHNQCGTFSICDTVSLIWGSIADVVLSNISLYPNPANSTLTIDMRDNRDEITSNYTAIEVYDALGQRLISQPHSSQYKIVNISVAALPEGIYLATLVDASGARRTIGKFNVIR